jgi:hypothetical protein
VEVVCHLNKIAERFVGLLLSYFTLEFFGLLGLALHFSLDVRGYELGLLGLVGRFSMFLKGFL